RSRFRLWHVKRRAPFRDLLEDAGPLGAARRAARHAQAGVALSFQLERVHKRKDLSPRHEPIGIALERIVDGKRLGVGERQELHHDHARDAARGIDPEPCVVDAAPAQAAGRTLAGYLIDSDEEAKPKLVASVSD